MPETALFSLKNRKNRPVLEYSPPAPLSLWWISPISKGIKGAHAPTEIFLAFLGPSKPPDT